VTATPVRSPTITKPKWTPVLCESGDDDHEVPGMLVAYQRRPCGHRDKAPVILCAQHGVLMRRDSDVARPTQCEECGEIGPLTLDRITDITIHRYVGIVQGIDFEERRVRDRQLQEWYQQHVRLLRRTGYVQPVLGPGPLGTWELLPQSWPGRDRIAPSHRGTFTVITCAREPT